VQFTHFQILEDFGSSEDIEILRTTSLNGFENRDNTLTESPPIWVETQYLSPGASRAGHEFDRTGVNRLHTSQRVRVRGSVH
jgi:hypothetical protein